MIKGRWKKAASCIRSEIDDAVKFAKESYPEEKT
jgi:hypothetical protein